MMRLVLPRENPRPDRRPGENQRCGERVRAAQGHGVGGRGQASRPAIRHALFRGAAPYPVVDASFVSFTPPPTAGSLATLRLLSKQNPLRSRWQLCCLTDAAYPLRVKRNARKEKYRQIRLPPDSPPHRLCGTRVFDRRGQAQGRRGHRHPPHRFARPPHFGK